MHSQWLPFETHRHVSTVKFAEYLPIGHGGKLTPLPSLTTLSPTVFTIKNGKSVLRSAVVELRIELEVFARRQAELQFARVSR